MPLNVSISYGEIGNQNRLIFYDFTTRKVAQKSIAADVVKFHSAFARIIEQAEKRILRRTQGNTEHPSVVGSGDEGCLSDDLGSYCEGGGGSSEPGGPIGSGDEPGTSGSEDPPANPDNGDDPPNGDSTDTPDPANAPPPENPTIPTGNNNSGCVVTPLGVVCTIIGTRPTPPGGIPQEELPHGSRPLNPCTILGILCSSEGPTDNPRVPPDGENRESAIRACEVNWKVEEDVCYAGRSSGMDTRMFRACMDKAFKRYSACLTTVRRLFGS